MSPIGGRVSPIGGRVSPVGAGNYPSAAKVVADAHAAQVQRQKALAAQQAQRQQARAQLEEEKRRLALVRFLTITDPENHLAPMLTIQQCLYCDRLVDSFAQRSSALLDLPRVSDCLVNDLVCCLIYCLVDC